MLYISTCYAAIAISIIYHNNSIHKRMCPSTTTTTQVTLLYQDIRVTYNFAIKPIKTSVLKNRFFSRRKNKACQFGKFSADTENHYMGHFHV